jgi:hypothetical protein
MDILSLSLLLIALAVFDEVLNGQLKVSRRLLNWFDKKRSSTTSKTSKN